MTSRNRTSAARSPRRRPDAGTRSRLCASAIARTMRQPRSSATMPIARARTRSAPSWATFTPNFSRKRSCVPRTTTARSCLSRPTSGRPKTSASATSTATRKAARRTSSSSSTPASNTHNGMPISERVFSLSRNARTTWNGPSSSSGWFKNSSCCACPSTRNSLPSLPSEIGQWHST
ncbi:hypothetical protein EXIGLDRAFT_251329 [Exidia glandulosa HHB12029]|uniref:Uncharacterized protein n=1 Tax=Exidia glandulosa HHB12029 TaxID=1314781 RepID=A0A165MHW5_EXIGL|nr:hypothetical protein EXIGLDRAFT_251329 [Exidia glandulosa HHB12029]